MLESAHKRDLQNAKTQIWQQKFRKRSELIMSDFKIQFCQKKRLLLVEVFLSGSSWIFILLFLEGEKRPFFGFFFSQRAGGHRMCFTSLTLGFCLGCCGHLVDRVDPLSKLLFISCLKQVVPTVGQPEKSEQFIINLQYSTTTIKIRIHLNTGLFDV